MELQLYLDIFKRRAYIIVIVAAMTVLIVTAIGELIPPVYRARTTVRVLLDVGVTDFILREDYNRRLLNTYTHVLKTNPMLERAIGLLPTPTPRLNASDLRDNVTVEVVPETDLISVIVQDRDRKVASALANNFATLLVDYSGDLYVGSDENTVQIIAQQLSEMEAQIKNDRQQLIDLMAREDVSGGEIETLENKIVFREEAYSRLFDRYELARLNEALRENSVSIIAPASPPSGRANALGLRDVALSGVVGLMGGIGLALVLENLDTRIHSVEQLENLTNFPVLGSVPRGVIPIEASVKDDGGKRPPTLSSIAEAYQIVMVNLLALEGITCVPSLLVTNISEREGKSMVVANLAHVLADRGQTVFLIEGDLRDATLFEQLGWAEQDDKFAFGLRELLVSKRDFNASMIERIARRRDVPGIFTIDSGRDDQALKPALLLSSPVLEQLVSHLSNQGHFVLFDAPPVLGTADNLVLAPKMGGVILTIKQGVSRRPEIRTALKQLQSTHARILGLIFVQK